MTAYNKLRLAILAILASQSAAAITLQPLRVMSSPGELLYAEMNFSRADADTPLEVSLASTSELQQFGINSQAPAGLNFYTRRTSNGNGVIVITSSRPLNDSDLNIVLKVKEGNNTRIQQIKAPLRPNPNAVTASEKPLAPEYVVSEKDIGLNLPQSTEFNTNNNAASVTTNKPDQQLAISAVAPPTVQAAAPATMSNTITPTAAVPPVTPTTVSTGNLTIRETRRNPNEPAPAPAKETALSANAAAAKPDNNTTATPEQANQAAKNASKVAEKTRNSRQSKTPNNYVVQRNDSLWAIANRIAAQTKQPVNQVMQRLQEQNQSAFVGGDPNRLRQGVALNLAAANRAKAKSKDNQKAKNKAAMTANNTAPQSGKAKIKLKEAELKLVAESDNKGERGNGKNSGTTQSDSALQSKVTETRQKALKMQKQVTGLELGLRQKDQRIQLLNARLAQLQQQLKQQEMAQKAKKPAES